MLYTIYVSEFTSNLIHLVQDETYQIITLGGEDIDRMSSRFNLKGSLDRQTVMLDQSFFLISTQSYVHKSNTL